MVVYVVMTIARQEYGEIIFVRSEKGFKDKDSAEQHAKQLSNETRGILDIPGAGSVRCAFERGVYTVEVE